jgi:hypothetical protein
VSKASLKKAIGRENWQPILRKWTKTSWWGYSRSSHHRRNEIILERD